MWEFLKGKKTYIVGILMIILGFLQDDQAMILNGFGFITLRVGLVKELARLGGSSGSKVV